MRVPEDDAVARDVVAPYVEDQREHDRDDDPLLDADGDDDRGGRSGDPELVAS